MSIFRRQGSAPPEKARRGRGAERRDRDGARSSQLAGSADVAPNRASPDGPPEAVPYSAQAAYDELVAKLRDGPIPAAPPPAPRASRWPWRRKATGPRLTAAQRKEARFEAKAAKAEAKSAAKAAKADARLSASAAKADAKQAKADARAAAAEAKRAERAARPRGRLARFLHLPVRTRSPRPVKRDVAGGGSWTERNFSSLQKVKRIDLIIFSRQMATFIRAGIPIIDGIRVVRE